MFHQFWSFDIVWRKASLRVGFEAFAFNRDLFRIENPCSKPQGMFCLTALLRSDRKERCHFVIRSLTPPQVADAP
jgi:hypothetical protein